MQTGKLKLLSLVFGGAFAALAFSATDADARYDGALASMVRSESDASCIVSWAQGVENNCNHASTIAKSLPIDTANTNYSPVAYFFGNANTSCRSLGISYDQSTIYTPGFQSGLSDYYGNAIWQTKALQSTFVPALGQLIVECSTQANDKISGFAW
ncbi:MAG TPA: hypothetical protein VK745_27430 [Polyangiaceae bacterium]|jgi:hypothetical protein|nr:hypothetical protein [Polyangiaceae bacterium]